MKKVFVVVCALTLLACGVVPVSASAQSTEEGELCTLPLQENPMTQEEMELYNALSDMKAESGIMPAAEGGHTVKVTTPVDAQFRNRYSSWAWEVLRAVDDADDYLGEEFNINYSIVSNKLWSSSSTTISALLNEAKTEWGLRDNASLMIAFTGRYTGQGGAAYTDSKYCIIVDQGRAANTFTVQHETGHCYGLEHCYFASCLMHQRADLDNLNHLDSSCHAYWYRQRLVH